MIRLRKNSQFKRVYTKGKSSSNGLVVLCLMPNGIPETRIGFSVSKKVGGAVTRNRVKRRMREIVRNLFPTLNNGFDVVIIARKRIATADFSEIALNIERVLKKSGLN